MFFGFLRWVYGIIKRNRMKSMPEVGSPNFGEEAIGAIIILRSKNIGFIIVSGFIVSGCIVSGCIVSGCIVSGCIVSGFIVSGCIVSGCILFRHFLNKGLY
jgi:uncharacterized membrane protein